MARVRKPCYFPQSFELWGKRRASRILQHGIKIITCPRRRLIQAREGLLAPGALRCGIRFLGFVVLVAVVFQGVVLAAAVAPALAGEEESPLFRQVGTLERFPEDARALLGPQVIDPANAGSMRNGTLLPIPRLRQLWQIWNPTINGGVRTFAVVRDLDSLEISDSFRIDKPLARGGTLGSGGEWVHAVDEAGKRLFLMRNGSRELIVYDLKDFSKKSLPFGIFLEDVSYSPVSPNGISWDPISGRIWAMYGKHSATIDPFAYNFLVRINPDVPDGSSPLEGSRLVRGCRGSLPGNEVGTSTRYSSKILRWGEHLHIPCHRDLASTAVAILRADEALDPTRLEELVVGPAVETLSVLADEEGGRLHFITDDSQDWVWDAEAGAFVGAVALGGGANVGTRGSLSVGLDREFGRLYLHSKDFGLGFVETRYTPVGQATIFPELGPGAAGIPFEMIHVDPPTRRIFVLPAGRDADALAYRILEVPPPAPPQPIPDPDGNTADVPEVADRTIADFAGSAGAYAIRMLAAGGLVKAIPMPVFGFQCCSSPLASFFNDNNSRCGYTDREMVVADVLDSKLAPTSARAVSYGFSLDERTQQNLRVPSQCDLETSLVPGFSGIFGTFPKRECSPGETSPDCSQYWERQIAREWKPASASCSVPGSEEPTASRGDPPLGKASVTCPADPGSGQVLSAEASGEVDGPMLSGGGFSKTTMYRDPERGLVSRAEALARGVTFIIPGGLTASIGEIRHVAESWSDGRPKEGGADRSSRTVTVSGFVGPDGSRCDTCDIQAVIDALNTAFIGRAYFREGAHDETLYQGSPRGAQAAVQKSDAQRESDRATVGDGRNEVAALEIITYNDTPPWGRARQIYQLAGVKTASTYNISCLLGELTEEGCPGPPPPTPAGLTIFLTDGSNEIRPLAGGMFALYRDIEGDGLLDVLTDELLILSGGEPALCTTGEDGTGDCRFEEIAPGGYVIRQVAAPPGYFPIEDFGITLEESFVYDLTFTNLEATGAIEITLTDDSGSANPLAGGVFEVFADDGNGAVDAADLKVGECTTDDGGVCGFVQVPLGAYVVRQAAAPADYAPFAETQAVRIELPGQVARLIYRNGPVGIEAEEPSPLFQGSAEVVVEHLPASRPQVQVLASSAPPQLRALPRVVSQVGEGLRLLLFSPREAAMMATAWLLFLSPLLVGGRRRLLRSLSIMGSQDGKGS